MATYLNYGDLSGPLVTGFNVNTSNTYSISVSNFDYTNNYIVVCKQYTTYNSSFSGTSSTVMHSYYTGTNAMAYYVVFYSVTSANFTINTSSGTVGYFQVPKTCVIVDNTTGSSSNYVTTNISASDWESYKMLYVGNCIHVTGLNFISAMTGSGYGSTGFCNLFYVTEGVTTISVWNYGYSSAPQILIKVPIADWPDVTLPTLAVGDVLNYTTNNISLDLTGYQFGCRLKGNTTQQGSSSPDVASLRYGANCYAEFDFSSVSDGIITLDSNYGSYIALTNGTGTDIKYNRMMVAGDAGGASYVRYSGSYTYYRSGGSAGLFGASGNNGAGTNVGRGGTQSAGGVNNFANNGVFGLGGSAAVYTSGSSTYSGGRGGYGWYGGASGYDGSGSTYSQGGAGGGSSYLLTADSYKPTGYFPEWTTYAPLISNGTSAVLTGDRDYYATITILAVPQTGPVLTSITVSGMTTAYHVGDTFSFDGTCTANYSDGTSEVVTPTSVSTPDMTTAGIKTITVAYSDGSTTVTATYDITVTAVTLTSITLSGQTTTYYVGDTFTFTGTCTAHYSDTSTLNVNPTSVSSPDMTTAGQQTVTVSYTEGGVTETATYTITVSAVQATSITISGQTVTYYEGDTFSIDGTVTAHYNNGSTADVTSQSTASGYDTSYVGQQTVTISWNGLTTTITITVVALTPTALNGYGLKTSFLRGEPFGFGSGFFIATYNNGSQANVTSDVGISGYDMFTLGSQTVTASYLHNNVTVTTTYTITVSAPTGNVYFNYTDEMVLLNGIQSKIGPISEQVTVSGETKYRVTMDIDHTKQKVICVCVGETCNSSGTSVTPEGCSCSDASYTENLRTSNAFNYRCMYTMSVDNPKVIFPKYNCGYAVVPLSTTIQTSGSAVASETKTISTSSYDFNNYRYYLFVDSTATNLSSNLVEITSDKVGGDEWAPIISFGPQSGGAQKIYRVKSGTVSFTMIASKLGDTANRNCYIAGDNYFIIRVPEEDCTPPTLMIGDKIYYTKPQITTNLRGLKFSCRLKGYTRTDSNNNPISYGANCYAEFDFSNPAITNGEVLIESTGACSFLALTNNEGYSPAWYQLMVAGSGGTNTGAHAGLFGGSASAGNGASIPPTQSSVFPGGNGWTQGTWQSPDAVYASYPYPCGGTSYILTADSYKPEGYFSAWSLYSPVITNATSELLDAVADYRAEINILSNYPEGIRTVKYYNGSVWKRCKTYYYDGTSFTLCNFHYCRDRLPAEYQEVQYIAPTGTSGDTPYIDIGVTPTNRTRVKVKATIPYDAGYLFYAGSGSNSYSFSALSDISKYRSTFGTDTGILTTASQSDPFIIDKNMNTTFLTLNNGTETSDTVTDQAFTITNHMYIFAGMSGNTVVPKADGVVLYYCKVYSDGTLIRDLIPCYRKSDNVVGLYDIVNSVFYTKSGNGSLFAGPNSTGHD